MRQNFLFIVLLTLSLMACHHDDKDDEGLQVYPETQEVCFDSDANEVTLKIDQKQGFLLEGFRVTEGENSVYQRIGSEVLQYHGQGDWFEFDITKEHIYVKVKNNPNPFERSLVILMPHDINSLERLTITQCEWGDDH